MTFTKTWSSYKLRCRVAQSAW